MTREEKEIILQEYQLMRNRYDELSRVDVGSIRYDLPRIENGCGYNPQIRIISEKMEIEKRLAFIENAVSSLEDITSRYLIDYLYIQGMTAREISDKNLLCYSVSQLSRIKQKALEDINLSGYREIK